MSEALQKVDSGATGEVPTELVASARRAVARQAKELGAAALELEQLALLPEPEFEEALVLPPEEVAKRYTATNGKAITERREQMVKMLSLQMDIKDICWIMRANHRTVQAVAAQEGQKIGIISRELEGVLKAEAMADLMVARTKRGEASYKDLHIGAGIKLQHAAAMQLISAGTTEEAAVEVEADDPRRLAFLEKLKQLEAGKEKG